MLRYFVCLATLFLVYACTALLPPAGNPGNTKPPKQLPAPSGNTGNDADAIIVPGSKTTIKFTVNTAAPQAINTNILGFNTGFMFGGDIQNLPEVIRLHKTISPVTLRFPGGTIANFYHPDRSGYGFKEEEAGTVKDFQGYLKAQPYERVNFVEPFAQMCKLTNTRVMYVANMLTGTIEENIKTIDKLQSHGLTIVGIELGNEFLLKRYRPNYPTVETYIEQAKTYAQAFRKKYPNIPLAVVGSEEGTSVGTEAAKFTNLWNATLAKENFYDAVVYHFYAKTGYCNKLGDQGSSLKEVFDCALETTAIEHYDMIKLVTDDLVKTYGTKRKIWITEWNTAESPRYVGNTFVQAAMAAEFMFNTIEFNARNNNLIEYAHFHNYAGSGFANTMFSFNTKKLVTLNGDATIGTNCSYYPFAFYKSILLDAKAGLVPVQFNYSGGLNDKLFNLQAYYSSSSKKLFLYFVNKSGQNIQLENPSLNMSARSKMLVANNLYSTTGQTGFSEKRPNEVSYVKYKEASNASLLVPAYSLGYFEIAL